MFSVCVYVFGIHVLKMLLREDFERLIWCLNHWLSCTNDYIHVCVFLFSKNCFKSFLDTWLAFSYRKLDTSSTPGGSIKKVPIPSIAYLLRASRSYWDCLKTVFQRREKHKYECNQANYSTKDPNNILSSQNHLLTRKICLAHRSKTHTHIKQV